MLIGFENFKGKTIKNIRKSKQPFKSIIVELTDDSKLVFEVDDDCDEDLIFGINGQDINSLEESD